MTYCKKQKMIQNLKTVLSNFGIFVKYFTKCCKNQKALHPLFLSYYVIFRHIFTKVFIFVKKYTIPYCQILTKFDIFVKNATFCKKNIAK